MDTLYADSFMDMVILDIRNLDNIVVENRVNNIFEYDKIRSWKIRINLDVKL